MDISNTISVTDSKIAGVLLFASNSNFWIYGYEDFATGRAVLIALSNSFDILYNNKPTDPSVKFTGAASDGTGNAYFAGTLGNPSESASLVKYTETT